VQSVEAAAFEAVGSTAADVLVKVRLMALLGLARHAAVISYQDIQVRTQVSSSPTLLSVYLWPHSEDPWRGCLPASSCLCLAGWLD